MKLSAALSVFLSKYTIVGITNDNTRASTSRRILNFLRLYSVAGTPFLWRIRIFAADPQNSLWDLGGASWFMGVCSSAPAEPPIDYAVYFARIRDNLQLSFDNAGMPFLIVEFPCGIYDPSDKYRNKTVEVMADGPMPEDVLTEFKFERVEGSATSKTKIVDCPSMALLLSALVDKHGWKLIHTTGRGAAPVQYVLQKDAS